MDLKNNIKEQRNFLKENLDIINKKTSDILGTDVNFEIKEYTDYKGMTYFILSDEKNRREECGIMRNTFEKVWIENFGMWWNENCVIFKLDFKYEHIGGGNNGSEICIMKVENRAVSLL